MAGTAISEVDRAIGKWLNVWRSSQDMTQQGLARAMVVVGVNITHSPLKVTQTMVSRWESGNRAFHATDLMILVRLAGVSLNELFTDLGWET